MAGAHNVKNALAAMAIATAVGVDADTMREGLAAFAGVKRRLETVGSARGVTVLDDFAHHPTAVRETLAAVRAVASRRADLGRLRAAVGLVVPARVPGRVRRVLRGGRRGRHRAGLPRRAPDDERLSPERLVADLVAAGRKARFVPDVGGIVELLARRGPRRGHRRGDVERRLRRHSREAARCSARAGVTLQDRPAPALADRQRLPQPSPYYLMMGFGSVAGGWSLIGSSRSRIGPPVSRPTRNGRRSTSVRSSTRTMCGVSVMMMSVSLRSVVLWANSRPMSGMSLSPGMPVERRPLLVADESGQHAGFAVAQADDRVDRPVAERRQAAVAFARDGADLHLERQRHVVVVVRARRDVDVHADVLVDVRRDRLLVHAAGGDRREGRVRHRHALAEPAPGPRCPQSSRSCGLASMRELVVGLEQAVEERRETSSGRRRRRSASAGRAA